MLASCVLCGAVLLLAVLCCSGCGVPCRVVPCLVVLLGWCGAALGLLMQLAPCCVLCRARWRCAVLSCVAPFAGVLCLGAQCCDVPLCAVVGCFVPSGVRCRCAVGCVLGCAVVCCCVLCCAFGRGVWLRCAVLSSFWLAVSSWSRCCVLCCAFWCCAGPCRVVLCCVVHCCCALCCGGGAILRCLAVCGAASCCGVPSGALRCLGCCVLCCMLCCAAVCCAVPWDVVSWSAVLCCSCCVLLSFRGLFSCVLCSVSWCCAALCCPVLSHAVQCCCALCCLRGAVLSLLALFVAVACCALSSGVVPCYGVLCHLVRRFAALPCAVCAVLCVFCRCVLVCAVVCCCPLCCWRPVVLRCVRGYLRACSKTEKTVSHFQKRKNYFPLVSCLVHPVLPACNNTTHGKTSPLYLFKSWTWVGVHGRSCSCLRPCTCSERGGKRDGDGAVAGGEGTWRIRKRGAGGAECRAVTC